MLIVATLKEVLTAHVKNHSLVMARCVQVCAASIINLHIDYRSLSSFTSIVGFRPVILAANETDQGNNTPLLILCISRVCTLTIRL